MSQSETMRLSCHCDASEMQVRLTESLTASRRCDCSFCRRRGAMTVTVNDGDLQVLKGDALSLDQFGTYCAEHYFCRIYGCYTHHRRSSNRSEFGVNVGGLEGVNPRDFDPVPWWDGVNYNPVKQGNV